MCRPIFRPWMRYVLLAAAAYNVVWGLWALIAPTAAFELAGLRQPNYPELWQAAGMVLVIWGIGYVVASINPVRYWPVVLMGLLAKIGSVMGFVWLASSQRIPWKLGWVVAANDLIWWIPFALILYRAYDYTIGQRRITSPEVQRMALRTRTNRGASLEELSRLSPVMMVFLRHVGCTFCREALADLARARRRIEGLGTRVVLVHMGTEECVAPALRKYGLSEMERISDLKQTVYHAFGLGRGRLLNLFGPKVWFRGFQAAVLRRHGVGTLAGDGFQMPGVFVIYHGQVLRSYMHQSAADRPDYVALASDQPYPQTGTVA